jgi:uncharacterized lipoprotein
MRALIICAAGALALAACQREEPADPVAAADVAVETAADAPAPAGTGGSAAPTTSESTPVPADGSSDTMGAQPPPEAVVSGPSPEVRDTAKARAEETNLHPRTP